MKNNCKSTRLLTILILILFSCIFVPGCINPYEHDMKGIDEFMTYLTQVKQINQNASNDINNKNWPDLSIQANNLQTLSSEELKNLREYKSQASPDLKPIFEDLENVVIADAKLSEDIRSIHDAYTGKSQSALEIATKDYSTHWEERGNNMVEAGTKLKALGKRISGE